MFGATMRGAVAADPPSPRLRRAGESGRAAKREKQRWRLVSTAQNRSASAPERKPVSELTSAYS